MEIVSGNFLFLVDTKSYTSILQVFAKEVGDYQLYIKQKYPSLKTHQIVCFLSLRTLKYENINENRGKSMFCA